MSGRDVRGGGEPAVTRAGAPVVRLVTGGERFEIRTGVSGRRYVFSRLDHPIESGDLDGAVVAITARGSAGARRLLWIGTADRLPPGVATAGREIHAHWLAETPAARARVVADLVAAEGARAERSRAGGPSGRRRGRARRPRRLTRRAGARLDTGGASRRSGRGGGVRCDRPRRPDQPARRRAAMRSSAASCMPRAARWSAVETT